MVGFRHLIKIFKQYTKYPLTILRHEWCKNDDPHHHICYAARLLGSDLPKVCPFCTRDGFEPEYEDECDLCKYFGIMDITENGFALHIDSRVAKLEEPALWVNITSDMAKTHRGWSHFSVPVLSIIRQYAEKYGVEFEGHPLVLIDDTLLTSEDVNHASIGKYFADRQEVNIKIKFERSN